MENGQRSPRAECSDQPSLKTRLSCSQDPQSFSLNVEAQGGTSSPVLLLSRSPARRRRGVPTYPMHSQGLAAPSGYSESHLAQSGKKKNPLGHVVQLSGAQVSVECILLPFNLIYSFSSTLNAHLHRGYALIKRETHEMEKSGSQKETEKYPNTHI